MLANHSKSVAVSAGHIRSYDSNRWAMLTGLPLSMSLSHLSLSQSCLSPVCPTGEEGRGVLHKLVFQLFLSPPPT